MVDLDKCFTGAAAAASVATLSVTVLSSYLLWRRSKYARARSHAVRGGPGNTLPSPLPALPRWCGFIGGHTLVIRKDKIVEDLENWAEEFGGDFELQLAGTRVICVTGLSDIRRILTLRPSKFKRGLVESQMLWAAEQVGMNHSMFFKEGKEWGRSRRLISPKLNGHNVAAMLPVVSKMGERLCDKLGAKADTGEVVIGKDIFARFTHDIIALVAFGVDVGCITATAEQPCHSYDAIGVLTTAFGRLMAMPRDILEWKFLPMVPWVRFTKENSRRLKSVIQDAIDAVRSEDKVPAPAVERDIGIGGTLLRKIVRSTSGKGGSSSSDRMLFSDQEVMSEAVSLFIGGTDTTAVTLCWAMYYLSKHPEAILRCRAEALKTAPLSDGMASTSEQLSQLKFCSAVFQETLRLRTPTPLLTLNCTEDFTLESGFVLEKGQGVFVFNRAAGVSDEFFTRGKEFVPERWIETEREEALLGKRGAAADGKSSVIHEAGAFLSLGHGPRICPGQDMAKAEGAVIIAAICARFDVSMAPGQADPPEEHALFTCGPKELNLILLRARRLVNDCARK